MTQHTQEFPSKTKIAFFDIDGTLKRKSLLIEVVEELLEEGIFEREKIEGYYKDSKQKWEKREGSFDDYISDVVKAHNQNLKGVRELDYIRISEKIINRSKGYLYSFTPDLSKLLGEEGYTRIAISHSPKELVDQFGRELGMDYTYGRIYLVGKDGLFTGEQYATEKIDDKSKAINHICDKFGLDISSSSIMVGDTTNDSPAFQSVQYPICFNPSQGLKEIAIKEGWPYVVERKDSVDLVYTKSFDEFSEEQKFFYKKIESLINQVLIIKY